MDTPDFHPFLPLDLLNALVADPNIDFNASEITNRTFEKFRVRSTAFRDPSSDQLVGRIDEPVVRPPFPVPMAPDFNLMDPRFEVNRRDFSARSNKNFLHLAVSTADVPLAYEVIRMGLGPDEKDRAGVTPLHLALTHMLMYTRLLVRLGAPVEILATLTSKLKTQSARDMQVSRMQTDLHRLQRIATLLIEQHADVNTVAYDRSVLSLTIELGSWKLVELLLIHRAKLPTDFLFSRHTDEATFKALLKKVKVPATRPPRLCPCHSGRSLDACHNAGEPIPYPHHFICGCNRNRVRVYGQCCVKRGVRLVEGWIPEISRLGPYEKPRAPNDVPEELHKYYYKGLENSMKPQSPEDDAAGRAAVEKDKGNFLMPYIKQLGLEDEMDPAFLYGLNHTSEWFPTPWTDTLTKEQMLARQTEWNGFIDEYIKLHGDEDEWGRTALEIEVDNKIAVHGGPMYRHCEEAGCDNAEKRDVPRMQACAGCKMIFYCSRECQTSDWKNHKRACKTKTHPPQMLETQTLVVEVLEQVGVALGMRDEALGL